LLCQAAKRYEAASGYDKNPWVPFVVAASSGKTSLGRQAKAADSYQSKKVKISRAACDPSKLSITIAVPTSFIEGAAKRNIATKPCRAPEQGGQDAAISGLM